MLQEVFRAGLNKLNATTYTLIVGLHLIWGNAICVSVWIPNSIFVYSIMLQQQSWKHFAKKQTTLQAVVYLAFTTHGDKLSSSAPSPFVAA